MIWIVPGLLALVVVVFAGWQVVSRRWSVPCPVWLRGMVEMDNPFAREHRAGRIVGHLDLRPGMTVADIGCGPGRVTLPLARAVGPGGRVVALDLQAGMLRHAREKAEAAGLDNIDFLEAGLASGALGRDRFDRAVLVAVLGEIPDRAAALAEIRDALRPGGILSVTELVFDPHFQRRGTLRRLAAGAGLRETAVFGPAFAYTMHFERPGGENDGAAERRSGGAHEI